MKKSICYFIIIVICISIFIFIMNYNKDINILDYKISLIEQKYFETIDINEIKNNEENVVVISVGNNKQKAIVEGKYGKNFKEVYNNAKNSIKKQIKEKNYPIYNVKIDLAQTIEEFSIEQFKEEIEKINEKYSYKRDIILDYENAEDIILIEAELNSNNIINYIENTIDLENLNSYLESSGKSKVNTLPEKIKIFKSISYFCDENDNIYELYSDDQNTKRRKIDINETDNIEEIIDNSCEYLTNMLQDNGKFIYGYSALKNNTLDSYNIVRHAGAIWALSAKCKTNEKNSQKISLAIDYLIKDNSKKYNDITFIKSSTNESSLGANGLALVGICEYIERFKDTKYIEEAKKIGNAIIKMQQEDGMLIHEINVDDFNTTSKFITEYYDNEATLALCKLYGITKDNKYLEAAEKSLHYFIQNDYYELGSHWFSYALNEVTKYVDKEEYYIAGLKNIETKLEEIASKKTTSHTDFEMLLQGFELFDRILSKRIKIEELNNFPAKKFLTVIQDKANLQLNSYLYPEIAMYLQIPEKYENTFYIRSDKYRIRIDDIQHSMFGYMRYQENKDKIENYLKIM